MYRWTKLAAGVSAVAVGLLLAGCGENSSTAGTPTSSAGTVSTTPTPSPTPTVIRDPDVPRAELVPIRPDRSYDVLQVPSTISTKLELVDSSATAAKTFARWWDYLAPEHTQKSVQEMYEKGIELCDLDLLDTQKALEWAMGPQGNMPEELWANAKVEAEALVKSATEALCVYHPELYVTAFEESVMAMRQSITAQKPALDALPDHMFGHFAKKACDAIREFTPAILTQYLSYKGRLDLVTNGQLDRQGATLKLFVREAIKNTCPDREYKLTPYWN